MVLFVEFTCHFTPDFDALHASKVAALDEVAPVRLEQLRPDEIMKIGDLVVFADESCRQSKLAVRIYLLCDLTEALGSDLLHFIKKHETPLMALNEVHHLSGSLRPFSRIETQHTVRANEHKGLLLERLCVQGPQKLKLTRLSNLLVVDDLRVEYDDVSRVHVAPLEELSLPLL